MRAGIGLGSNLNDRHQMLKTAVEALHQLSILPEKDRLSSFYETAPVNCAPGTPNFLNAAMEIETDLSPLALLAKLQALEVASGRPREREKNQPRSLDLDLLYIDNLTLSSPELELPHPFITERQFVLAPLADIVPDFILPNQILSIAELWKTRATSENDDYIKIVKKLSFN